MKISAVNLNLNSTLIHSKPVMRQAYTYMQLPDTFERTTLLEDTGIKPSKTEVREEFSNTINTLTTMHDKARKSFNEQVALDGWSGKFADKISVLWGSKNRASLVNQDLKTFSQNINKLDKAAQSGNFRNEFREIFGVDFDKDAVDNFQKISENRTLIQASNKIAVETNKKLGSYVSYFDKKADYLSPDKFSDNNHKKFEEARVKLGEFKKNLSSVIGGENSLKELASAENKDFEKLTNEEKAKLYLQISKQLITASQETAKGIRGNKTDKEIQKEYDEAYTKAYGSDNDIVKRVDKYIRSQQVGAMLVRDSLLAGVIGASIALTGTSYPITMGSGITLAGNIGLDFSEYLTNNTDNKIDLSKKEVKIILKDAAITGLEYMAGSALYEVIPMANTASSLVNGALNTARTLGIELSTAFVAEYARTGKWATEQIDPKTFIKTVLATYAIEELTRISLSTETKTVGKKHTIPQKTMEQFTEKANLELNKMFLKNPRDVLNLKLINMQSPEKFTELLSKSLTDVLSEM